jgi:glutaredoxin 3
MPRIEVYTKAFCPYCSRALALLRSKDAHFEEFDITLGGARRTEMITRAGGRVTVPQIFINGAHIGGCDDLVALNGKGGLDPLLET